MATLRDPLFRTTSVTAQDLDELRASGMGSLRRGWESGRITNDMNANLADEAALRAEGTQDALTKADALARSTAGLRQRAGVYSPEVSRVEDIHGVGDALGWAGGQVGQGAASMADPLAASAALNAAGTAVGLAKNPLAQAASLGLRGAGYVVPYMMSKRQLKGEFYGDISQDPTVMANTTAQQRNDMSDNYGYVAAIPDSAIPGIVGGKFGGAGLRAGLSKIPGAARVAGEILGEGTTELGQEMGKQYAHGLLNPDRDTSQDASANLNSFLGGAVGAGAPVLAGHVADTGFRRVGNTAGVVAEKAGSVVDMAQPYVGKATDAVKAAAGKVRGKVVDMATGEDGTQSAAALKENLKAASQELQSKWQATQEERSTLMSVPPQGVDPNSPEFDAWFVKNTDERTELVAKRLDEMHQAGDQIAGELFRKTFTENGVDQDAMDEAAQYLISQTELGQLEKQANRFGEVAAKGGKLAGKAAVWAARKAGSAAKAFGSAVWDGVQEGSKKNAQDWTGSDVDAEFAQRKQARDEAIKNAVRMSEYLYTTAKTQNNRTASGPIADLLKDMGYEIAELADLSSPSALSAQPDLRRNLTGSQFSLGVNRIVNSLRVAYGPQTEQVIGNLRQMAAPSAAPVFDAMEQELTTQRQDKGGAHTAQIRSVAAQELVGLLDADAETKLLKEGINLRAPESQRQLLGMVEAVSLGRAAPQARKALEGLVGRETLNKMLAAVAPQTEQDAEGDTLVDDGGETAEQGFVVNEDGEIGEPASSLYDKEAAEKAFAKGQGARMYGFHATRNPRTDLDGKDPFAATTSMTKDEYKAFQQDNIARQAAGEDPLPDPRRRPMLFKKGQTLSEQAGGGLAIDKKIADLEKYLKVDRTPERMAALMREEGNEAGAKKVEALIARGDESAKATLDSAIKSFFVNRAGGWRVSPKSAWDVLQEQGAQPTRVLSLFRDYLRQDGDDERAEIVGKTLLDEMDQGRGGTKGFRVQVGMRKKVKAAAEKYFREHELAVAERLSDRNPGKFDEAELLQMHKSAQKIVDLARKDGGNKVIAAANILTFKSALSPNGGLLHIKVSDLVREVQKRRNESTGNDFENTSESFSNASKNQKYLDMVLDGVGVVMDSGRVDGWPYKINEKNQKEYFGEGQNGVPPSLMLATTTNQGFLFGKEQKVNAKAGERVSPVAGPRDPRSVEATRYSMDDADPIEVAKTLGQDGPFVPDSRVEQEPSGYETRHALSDEEYAHWNGLKTPSARSKYLATLRDKYGPEWSQQLDEYGVHGTQFAVFDDLNSERRDVGTRINPQSGAEESVTAPGYRVNRTSTRPHEARTDDPNKTQLDVARKPKGGKSETGAPDEYADQRARSVAQGYNPAAMKDPVERKVDAVARAAERAQPIVEALHRNFAEGVQAVERRLRTAEAPAYTTDKNAAAGGAHYVAPLAHALSAESVAQMDLGPAEAKQIQALRVRVASVLLNGGLKAAEKVALARALFPASAAERITLANVNERLAKVVGKAEAPVKEAGVSDAYLAAENFEDITTNAQADQFLRSAQKRFGELKAMDDLTPVQKKAYAVLDGLFGKSSTADLGSFYQDGRPDADVRKAIAPVKEAGASLGKAQSAPSGARNDQPGSAQKSTQAERDEALAEIRRTLGNKVNVAFADITGYSGEFVDADNLIRISTTPAAGTLQTAYHESLHAFFKQFVRSNPLAMDVIKALAEHKPTLDRVHALLEGYPEAQAALANGEERLAYMYQFWRAGLLDLPYGKPRTLFQKVLKAFRRVLGMVSDLERSTGLLKALASGQVAGDPSVAGKVINKTLAEGTWTRKQLRKMDGLTQMIAAAVLPANDVLASSDSDTAKVLAKTFWANPGDEADGGPNEGYLNARARMAARYTNEFSRFITGLNDRDLKALTEALQQENDDLDSIAFEPVREAAKRTRELIQRFRKYMVEERGLKLGDRGPNYFPRMWDTEALIKGQDKFVALMTGKYADMLQGDTEAKKGESALALHHALVSNNMVDGKVLAQRDDGVLTPFFAQGQARLLAWMDGADIAEFQSKDIVKTLTTYFHSGARAAEYASRFGQDGKKLDTALHNIELELVQAAKKRERRGEFSGAEARDKWVQRQMRDVRMAVDAMEGSIGKDGSATMRKIGSAMTVYQNVRLLPLALFSQVVDPLGMLARGATMKQAYESFLRGMKEVGNSWADMFREEPKERQPDRWEKLAMAVGSVDAAMFSHHVAEEYSSTYMSPWAKKINDTFFRVNGMEAWNRGMRVGATKAAVQFIEHHKKHPGEHSVRWLKELGLKPDEILLDDNGELITGWRSAKAAKEGWTDEQARTYIDRVHYAINRWVQGAILTPNAAQRPAWSSDPSYSAFFHLKQFSYSFHKTIMRRAVNELHYGNLAPLASFAWYIPAIIAADVTKGMALNAGELPQHLKGMDLADWVMHGIDRSGMLGVAGIGTDAAADISSLAGPGVEQIIDGFRDELGATTLNALPASPIAKALFN